MLRLTHADVVRYRLFVNHLTERLGADEFVAAAQCALQDSAPRSGLISLHARLEDCPPSAWEHPSLAQTYSPRAAVHLLPRKDFGVFTIGRLPADPAVRQAIETDAQEICEVLGDGPVRAWQLPERLRGRLRAACASGRIEIRWDARSLRVSARARPEIEFCAASRELARRHLHFYGPTEPAGFAQWAGMSVPDARHVWAQLPDPLVEVDVAGRSAWVTRSDEELLVQAPAMRGVRFLPAEEMRLLGERQPPRYDTFHPHGLLVDGQLIGSWGRRGGVINALLDREIDCRARESIEAEAATIPIPGAAVTVRLTGRAA